MKSSTLTEVYKIILELFISIFVSLFAVTGVAAPNQIYIKMGEAQTKKSLLAFPSIQYIGSVGANPNFQSISADLFHVIENDLEVSSLFTLINSKAFLEDPSKTSIRPFPEDKGGFKFEAWNKIGTDFLIRGQFNITGDEISLEMITYHVPKSSVVFAKKYKGTKSLIRRIAHTFCNDLLKELTGKEGMFLSRLVVASDRGGGSYREIYVMDWDGNNAQKVTSHRSITLSPSWSPDGKKVAYTAFVQSAKTKTRNADLFVYELETGKRWLISYRKGLNSGSVFHPNGESIYLTLSQNGNPDIYKISVDGSMQERITNGPRGAMNVEPSVSPDSKKIAFSSDRSGQPMIYIMNIDGSNPKRVTFAGKYNATPAWSPDGKKLAFSGWSTDHFDIFTMNADGTDMQRITSAKKSSGKSATNEDAVFSPDGRHLIYTSDRSGSNQIYISNLDGTEERRITNDSFNYYKPKWSINY